MSTIATDGKSMAADSQVTGGGYLVGGMTKIVRLPDGSIAGSAGSSDDAVEFRNWLINGGDKPNLNHDFECLILKTDGRVIYMSHRLIEHEYLSPMAIGSGGEIAIGAMLAGAKPHQAVSLAATRDTRTGGAVTIYHLEPSE